jgi:PAS domain S-box-containing protein
LVNDNNSLIRRAFCIALGAYLAGGRFGLILSDPISNITLVWPATGIAVAALVRWGFWCWPGVFLGALLVEKSLAHSWLGASGIAVGNTLGPVVAAWVLTRGKFDAAFERRRDIGVFCLAAMVGMLFSALGGTLNLCLGGKIPWSAFGPAALRWWLGDSGGVLLVGPLLLGLGRRELLQIRGRALEFAALCAATLGGGWMVFMREGTSVQVHPTTAFAVLPLVVWGALRFRMVGASFSACGLALMGAWGTAMGRSEFYMQDMGHGTLLLWWFIITSGFLGLMVTVLLTEQSKVGQALQQSEEQLRLLISGVKDYAIFMLEPDGRVASWNPEAARITGYQAAEIVGQHFSKFFSEADTAQGKPQQQLEAAQTAGRFEEEGWRVRKDGSRFWALGTLAAVHDQDRKLRGFAKVTQDLTERMRAEEALHQSEERYRSVVTTLAEGIVLQEADGKIITCNASAERILGLPCDEIVGRTFADTRWHWVREEGADFPGDEHPSEVALRTGQPQHGVILGVHRPDGTLAWLSLNARPLARGAAKPHAVVCSFVDVTSRKKAEAERQRLETQLRQSQKMEAIGQLSGGIAHDFNNLLTIIQGNASLLKNTHQLPADITQLIDDITQSADRAARLTGQLLAFSRQQPLQMRDLDLNEVVGNMTRILQRILGEHIRARQHFAARALYLHADAGMLDQILLNLAVNARDAMPQGGTLEIGTAIEEISAESAAQRGQGRAGLFACLTVRDTGSGIAPDVLPRVFEPFFTTKEFGKGSGLGLATVYGIVQQHQGWIEVASELNKGTTFRIFLPCLGGGVKAEPRTAEQDQSRRGTETILLVEDEPALRMLANKVLQQLGYKVYAADNGVEALSVWEEHRSEVQLLLTDIVMPDGLNGIELAAQLSAEEPRLKVLYMSGYSADFAGVQLEDGVNFLPKPFNPGKLATVVRSVLDAPQAT